MKTYLPFQIFSFVLFFAFTISAQDIVFEETFNDTTLGDFTEYSVIGDDQTWRPSDFQGKNFIQMNGYDDGIFDNEDWLISPGIDMDLYTDEILTFENASNFDGPDLELLVSTDYDGSSDPNSASWTNLTADATWSPGGYEYVDSGEIDLSSFTGTGYFAFKYTSNTTDQGKLYQIDSVVVRVNNTSSTLDNQKNIDLISNPYFQNNHLEFEILATELDLQFKVCNVAGTQVPVDQNYFNNTSVSIPLGDLPKGMYILSVHYEGKSKGYKFIK